MIYPIVAYGDPVLRQNALDIAPGTDVQQLAQDMLATIDAASAAGLAAPQIGKRLRIFAVDLTPLFKRPYRKVFINPVLCLDETSALQHREEYCLSIPDVGVQVPRRAQLTITYFDESWQRHEEILTDMPARVIQHEYDHLEGTLHVDYASSLRKRLIKNKLAKISQGQVDVPYKMRFPA